METKEVKSSVQDSDTERRKPKTTDGKQSNAKNSNSSMESIEVDEIIHENEQLAIDLGMQIFTSRSDVKFTLIFV
jgi:hypothetical protein